MTTEVQRPLIFLFLACLFIPPVSFSQILPISGRYTHEGQYQGFSPIGAAMDAVVNDCSDEITVHFGASREPLILTYQDKRYVGKTDLLDGGPAPGPYITTADMFGELRAVSPRRLKGFLEIGSGVGMGGYRWPLDLKYSGKRSPAFLKGGQVDALGTKVEKQGIFVTETTQYRIEINNFPLNSAELTGDHVAVLENAKKLFKPEPQKDDICFATESKFSGKAQGFANRRLERRNRESLKRKRAQSLHAYVAGIFPNTRWKGVVTSPAPGFEASQDSEALWPESSCARAAVAEFIVQIQYADMYTRDDTDNWLRERLRALKKTYGETERYFEVGGFGPISNQSTVKEREDQQKEAKSQWCLANNLLDLLKDGHCEIQTQFIDGTIHPNQTIEHLALKGVADTGFRGGGELTYAYSDWKGGVEAGWKRAQELDGTGSGADVNAGGATGKDGQWQANVLKLERMNHTDYYDYIYGGCGRGEYDGPQQQERKARADKIEREVFGENTLWSRTKKIGE